MRVLFTYLNKYILISKRFSNSISAIYIAVIGKVRPGKYHLFSDKAVSVTGKVRETLY